MNFNILILRIFSNNFEKTVNREIGRNSSSDLGEEVFGIGITYATLKSLGKVS